MPGFPEIKAAIDRQHEAIEAWREKHDGQQAEILNRIEELEAKASTPGRGSLTAAETAESREHKKRFTAWLRKPYDGATKQALGELQDKLNIKSVTIGSSADGGFAVPEEIARDIEKLELKLSPVRSLVRVRRVGTSDFKSLVNIGGADAGWVGESGSRTETETSKLREVVPTHGELYAYPKASEWSLDDIFFDVSQWLADEVSEQFASLEGAAVIAGDGSNKPTGMLHTSPVTTADDASPLRAATAYQYIPSLSTSSPAVAEIVPDALIDTVYSLNSKYRANASWTMNSTTAGAISKLKDSQGRYLWQQSLIAGMPSTLLGYPVFFWEQMDDIATNKFPVAFGDFSRGYLLTDRTQLRITVDPYTSAGFVKYYVRRREGGMPLNNNAIRFLKTTIA